MTSVEKRWWEKKLNGRRREKNQMLAKGEGLYFLSDPEWGFAPLPAILSGFRAWSLLELEHAKFSEGSNIEMWDAGREFI